MHGRLKIKEKAEIELEKKLKLKKKAEFFKKSLDICLEAKFSCNYDEKILRLNFELLTSNPDVYTLWNMRREYFLIQKKNYESRLLELTTDQREYDELKNIKNDILKDVDNDESKHLEYDKLKDVEEDIVKDKTNLIRELKENYDKICKEELDLTEYALVKNPKSYTAWHHRFWIISIMDNPNYMREFQLCEMYLQKDGRNFHCWDYRSMLCDFFGRSLTDEIKFSLNKIKDDISAFSYSTLYYRSLILTKASNMNLINFNKLWKEEYSLIENALFTEPNDQALWFYSRWLLKTNFGKFLSLNEHKESKLTKIIFNKKNKMIFCHFDYNTLSKPFKSFQITSILNDIEVKLDVDCKLFKRISSKVWYSQLSVTSIKQISFEYEYISDKQMIDMKISNDFCNWQELNINSSSLNSEIAIEKEQLDSLLMLKELEPDNKWLNLILSNFINTDQLDILNKLISMDPLRKNYYLDQQSKIEINKVVEEMNWSSNILSISNRGLTVLYSLESFAHITVLNLSSNKIQCLSSSLNELISVKELILDDNLIDRVKKNIKLLNLNLLSLKNNRLNQSSGLENLDGCIELKVLNLNGNYIELDDLGNLRKLGIQCNLN